MGNPALAGIPRVRIGIPIDEQSSAIPSLCLLERRHLISLKHPRNI